MGCGCLVALAAMLSARLGVVLTWLFTDRMSIALQSWWMGLVGFLFLPWTTLAYVWLYQPVKGIEGFAWFIVGIAFVADIMSYGSSERARRERYANA